MFCIIDRDGVKLLVSDKIKEKHGFSTRVGGVSTLPHTASLNLGYYRGDERETVIENLRRFSSAVDIPLEDFVSVTQIHSSDVRYTTEKDRGGGIFYKADYECDGYVTDRQGVALCVKTADCVPILFSSGDGIVGAVHAGWRGTARSIAAVCVERMVSLGARR
ncbi:MAG: laccase domain-containing protein, partial [Clostridia bacterium]|nr:laccase domain-containing protein [Clostridia bacterium]